MTAVALAAIFAAGCGSKDNAAAAATGGKPEPAVPPAEVKAGDEASLMPLATGNQWTYTSDANQITLKVANVAPQGDGKKATIEIFVNDKLTSRQVWLQNKTGMYQLAQGLNPKPFNPPQPILLFPIERGKVSKYTGTGPVDNATGRIQSELRVDGPQPVDTDMGEKSGILVRQAVLLTAGKVQGRLVSNTWFAPGIGIVRLRNDIQVGNGQRTEVLRLKNYTLK